MQGGYMHTGVKALNLITFMQKGDGWKSDRLPHCSWIHAWCGRCGDMVENIVLLYWGKHEKEKF